MKKLLLLLTMLLIGIGSTWATDVTLTSASQIKNGTFYDGSGNVQTSVYWWNKAITKSTIPITLDFGSDAAVSNYSGKVNVYGSKTLTITSPFKITGYTLTGTPTANCTVTPTGESTTNWTAATSGTVTVSGLNTYTTTIAFTGEADGNTECLIDITSFVITVDNLTDVSQISTDKYYILYNNGRSQFMNIDNATGQVMLSSLPSTNNGLLPYIVRFVSNTSAKSDGNAYQLKFYDGTFLPWQSSGSANYVSASMGYNGSSNEGYLPTYDSGFFTFQVYKGGTSRDVYFNGNSGAFTFWNNSTSDNGKYLIYEVDGTNLQEIDYNLNIEGNETSNNSRKLLTYKSLPISVPTVSGRDNFFDYATQNFVSLSSTTASADGSAISISGSWNLPFITTALVDGNFPADAQFYRMHLRAADKNKYARYGEGKISYVNSDATLTTADYFCFVGDAMNGFKIYNMAAGSSVVMGADNPTTGADIWMLGEGHPTHLWALHPNSEQGFTLRQTTGTSPGTDAYLHDYSSKFSYWHSSSALTDIGSGLAIEVADFGNVTYNVLLEAGGDVKATATATSVNNRVLSVPSSAAMDFCTYTYYTDQACTNEITELPFGTTTVYALTSYTMPFRVSSTFSDAIWNYATLRGKYLRADDSAKDGSGRYQTSATNGQTDAYKWAFFGNPYDGFYVMNKNQGDEKYLYKGSSQLEFQSDITPAEDNNALFAVTSNSNGGFTLRNIAGGSTWYVNDAGNGGNLGFWISAYGANDAGSNWLVTEVPVNVTYELYVSEEKVNTVVDENVAAFSTVNVPASLTTGYNTLAYGFVTSGSIGNEDCTITVTGTLKDGIKLTSELSNSKKYRLTCKRGSLSTKTITVDETSTTYLASPCKESLSIEGKEFAILNYNDAYYLYSVDNEQFVTYNSQQSLPLKDNVCHTSDKIAFTEVSSGVYAIKFNNDANKYLNSSSSYEYGIIVNNWGGSGYWDDGNQYVIEEVDDFDDPDFTTAFNELTAYENIIAKLEAVNWGLNSEGNHRKPNYYNMGAPFTGYAGNEVAIIQACKSHGYDDYYYNTLQGMDAAYALNMPTTGKFYRIQGSISSNYLASGLASNGKYKMTNADDASTIFYYDADSKLTNLGSGMCNGVLSNSWAWTTGENASTVTFQDGLSNGGYAIKSAKANNDNNANFYDNGDNSASADRGGNVTINANTNARYTHWYLTEITSLPVAFDANALGYATFDCPVAVKLPTDVEAYVCQINESTIKLYKADQVKDGDNWVLPANTPVLLYNTDMANETTKELTITSTEEEYTNNGFYGTTVAESPKTTDYLYYALRKKTNEETVGFYQRANQSSTLRGFRAWIRDEKQNARNFTIVFDGDSDPTGIVEALGLENDNVEIYDLNGRKLSSYQKGINIVNGKKVFK